MFRKCIICDGAALYAIRDRPEAYCRECALEQFSDLDLLERLDEEKQEKRVVKALQATEF